MPALSCRMKISTLQLPLAALLALAGPSAWAQPGTFPRNGVYDQRPGVFAFTHATLFVDYQTKIADGTLLIRDGKVVAAGPAAAVKIPAGAVVQDVGGKFIYPGLVDVFTSYGVPETPAAVRQGRRTGPQFESQKAGAYDWNQAIHPEVNAAELFKVNNDQATAYRALGFGAVLTQPLDGIMRGTAALVSLNTSRKEQEVLLLDKAAAGFSFDKGTSTQDYPSSLMGSIALLRQTYLDAAWNQRTPRREQNLSLAALTQQKALPAIFQVSDKLSALRADRLGDEAGQQYLIKGRGDEYQRLDDLKKTGAAFIVPLNFPEAYDVADVYDALRIPLEDLKHWELAPANAARLAQAGVPFALTAADLKDKKKFLPNLRKAAQYGLSEAAALRALTDTPARLLRAQDRLGALRPGMEANFLVCSAHFLADDNVLLDNWVQGERYQLSTVPADYRGVYTLKIGQQPEGRFLIQGKPEAPELKIVPTAGDTIKGTVTVTSDLATIVFNPKDKAGKPTKPAAGAPAEPAKPSAGAADGATRLSGFYTQEGRVFQGDGLLADGTPVKWRAVRQEEASRAAKRDSAKATPPPVLGSVIYPFVAYGRAEMPGQVPTLIQNATVWTSEAAGKLEHTDVLLENGRITRIGQKLALPKGGRTIDGTGKHLTPGLIDEHSHLAIAERRKRGHPGRNERGAHRRR